MDFRLNVRIRLNSLRLSKYERNKLEILNRMEKPGDLFVPSQCIEKSMKERFHIISFLRGKIGTRIQSPVHTRHAWRMENEVRWKTAGYIFIPLLPPPKPNTQ